MSDPVTTLANVTMGAFARASVAATPGSPFDLARRALGDSYADVAAAAMRAGLRRLLVEEREKTLRDLDRAGALSDVTAQTIVLGVVQEAIQEVIRAAAVREPVKAEPSRGATKREAR